MCGIVAIYAYAANAPPVSRDELQTIRDEMIARGPDGAGTWFSGDGRVGLGHRRLAIIDTTSEGLQPMACANGSIQLVFNGEIYNYLELRDELRARGHVFHSRTDTEVLLAGWLEWGQSLVDHLRGMFAFAIWDENKKGLFLARDSFGIKPLYIANDGMTIRAASQVKALLASRKVNTRPNAEGHVGFFLWGSIPEPHTLYRGIQSFPAGMSCWFGHDGVKQERRFSNVSTLLLKAQLESQNWSPEEVQQRLRNAVYDSVKKHLISDVPTGVFLSAGIDSCALAAVAQDVSEKPIHTLTLGFEEFRGQPADETPLAELMARELSSNHQTRWVRKQAFQADFGSFIKAMDQPSLDGLNVWFVCKAAKESGLKVALSGLGGDEFLGGYPSFSQIPTLVNKLRFASLFSPTMGRAMRVLAAPWLGRIISNKYAGLLEYGTSEVGAYLLRRGLFMPWELSRCLPPDLIREGLPPLLEALFDQAPSALLQSKGRISALEATLYMRNQLLRDSDWASMAHSIELRVPLVDLVFLTASSRANKQSLANAPNGGLPLVIANRSKTGFHVPTREWASGREVIKQERGLRGWALQIYKLLYPSAQ